MSPPANESSALGGSRQEQLTYATTYHEGFVYLPLGDEIPRRDTYH